MTHSSPFDRLNQLIQLERQDILTLLAYGAGIGVMSLATPVAVQSLVNTIAFGALFQPLLVLTLVLLVLVGFSNLLAGLQFYVVDMLQRRLFVRVFGEAAVRLYQTTLAGRDSHSLPQVANYFLDVVTLQKTASTLLLETLGYVLQTVIGMVLLAFYHPLLLAFDVFLIAALAGILFVLGRNGLATAIAQSQAKYAALAWLENLAANPVLGKSEMNAEFLTACSENIARDYLAACHRHFRVLSRQNTGALVLHTLASTLLLGMGGWMVIAHQLSLGQLIAAELVVSAMVYGLTRLGKMLENYYELLASLDKIGHLQDLPQEHLQPDAPRPANQPYHVLMSGVELPSSPHTDLIRDIDLELPPGARLAISAGAAHGSLLEVLYGLRLPSGGYVSLDGQDLRDVNLRQLRNQIALVRAPEILIGSIIDNLAVGSDLDLGVMRQTLTHVGLLSTVLSLPDGLHTRLDASGSPLSSEQSLRLTLARALLMQPRLLLLAGVLDQLDTSVLPLILEVICAETAPWTLVVTSQNPQVLSRCSRQAQIVEGLWVERP